VGAVHLAAEVLNRDVGLVRGGGKAA
jgi:hypothetical protein